MYTLQWIVQIIRSSLKQMVMMWKFVKRGQNIRKMDEHNLSPWRSTSIDGEHTLIQETIKCASIGFFDLPN